MLQCSSSKASCGRSSRHCCFGNCTNLQYKVQRLWCSCSPFSFPTCQKANCKSLLMTFLSGKDVESLLCWMVWTDLLNNSYVSRLLNGVLSEACLLATSRPCDAARTFFQSASSVFDANVEPLGFSEKQVDSFIGESLGSELAPKLKELLDKSPSLASLMSVPLLAVLVSQVFESSLNVS